MSEAKTVARPYAAAAWKHAEDQGEQVLWSEMLEFMASVVSDDAMSAIVSDPRVDTDTLSALMLQVCGDRINDIAGAFVRLLVENGKLSLMPEVNDVYKELRVESGGAIHASLTAAYPVNTEFEQAIAAAMRRRLYREVTFTTKIDKALLGGVIIRIGDMVIDASVRGQVEALAADLRT